MQIALNTQKSAKKSDVICDSFTESAKKISRL